MQHAAAFAPIRRLSASADAAARASVTLMLLYEDTQPLRAPPVRMPAWFAAVYMSNTRGVIT